MREEFDALFNPVEEHDLFRSCLVITHTRGSFRITFLLEPRLNFLISLFTHERESFVFLVFSFYQFFLGIYTI